MKAYSIDTICKIVNGKFIQQVADGYISHLVYDSRNISFAEKSLFFALPTRTGDGHSYILDAYQKGIRNFIVSKEINLKILKEASIIIVDDTLQALQQLASFHRSQFSIPVIGITGSNGKTIVKEWLYQLLQNDFRIVRSPKSYNSQIGVPLSVWQMQPEHTLAIFEAGISQTGEMKKLGEIIQPTIGIITNVGEAHNKGFESQDQKLIEKFKLFSAPDVIIGPQFLIKSFPNNQPIFCWGDGIKADLQIQSTQVQSGQTTIELTYKHNNFSTTIPFTDEASQQNAITCCCVLLYLGYEHPVIVERMLTLHAVEMRLQSNAGINHCTIINDSYSADLTSLNIALNFLHAQNTGQQLTVILSDFVETGKSKTELYKAIAENLIKHGIQKIIAIGEAITSWLSDYLPANIKLFTYKSIEIFINEFQQSMFQNEMILVKGARSFRFERIVQLLQTKVHQTVLEVNLNSIVHNLKEYRKILRPQTRIMAMVKAFAYGSGGAEIARVLQFNNIDYLGVAYADEGIDLRKSGISVPIMVMNADASSFAAITEFNLHPAIYSFQLLTQFEDYLNEQGLNNYPVHIEIESGMNRLGFNLADISEVAEHLKNSFFIKIETVYSHLAASEDPTQDVFTNEQAMVFYKAVSILENVISYPFLKHISNSAAIIRHPNLQMGMVRLGIGLYGIEISKDHLNLQPVATLRSTIAQLKTLKAGETISYNRRGIAKENMVIATIRIGYADGYSRLFGNGIGKMWVNGKLAPVIGNVCMDMTMIDVTNIKEVQEGNEVIIFGEELSLQQMAEWAKTIPYEIMTSVSQRVKRVYYHE